MNGLSICVCRTYVPLVLTFRQFNAACVQVSPTRSCISLFVFVEKVYHWFSKFRQVGTARVQVSPTRSCSSPFVLVETMYLKSLVVASKYPSLTPTETWSWVVCVFWSWTSRTNVHQTHIVHAEVQCVWTMRLYRALRNVSIDCAYTYMNMYNADWTSVLHVLCGLPNRQCKKNKCSHCAMLGTDARFSRSANQRTTSVFNVRWFLKFSCRTHKPPRIKFPSGLNLDI